MCVAVFIFALMCACVNMYAHTYVYEYCVHVHAYDMHLCALNTHLCTCVDTFMTMCPCIFVCLDMHASMCAHV